MDDIFKKNPLLNKEVIAGYEQALEEAKKAGIDVNPGYRIDLPFGSIAADLYQPPSRNGLK